MTMATLEQILHAKAIEIGKLAVRATTDAGSGHPTSALSLAHLTTVLMCRIMRWDPKHPGHLIADQRLVNVVGAARNRSPHVFAAR
jgi:transketolase